MHRNTRSKTADIKGQTLSEIDAALKEAEQRGKSRGSSVKVRKVTKTKPDTKDIQMQTISSNSSERTEEKSSSNASISQMEEVPLEENPGCFGSLGKSILHFFRRHTPYIRLKETKEERMEKKYK